MRLCRNWIPYLIKVQIITQLQWVQESLDELPANQGQKGFRCFTFAAPWSQNMYTLKNIELRF